ncbi:MAG: hypothetical protein ACRDJW_14040 [Thermomicrobiales bacterium]
MALIHPPPDIVYHWPDAAALDLAAMELAYNPFADELTVAFGGTGRPAIIHPLDWTPADYVALRLDPETDEVVGIQLDHAQRVAAAEHPAWSAVIDAAASKAGVHAPAKSAWPALARLISDVKALARF